MQLRIFEQRYIDMVRECSVNDSCFGVCLINNHESTDTAATHFEFGTLARIFDFTTLDDGLLGISAQGAQRFVVQKTRMRDNGLLMAEIQTHEEANTVLLPEQYSVLSMIAARFMEQLSANYPSFEPPLLQDSHWVGYRLAELLPLEDNEKQLLLQLDDPLERLQWLVEALPRFQEPLEA